MTWGQLRLTLQIAAPGVSLDLVDAWINARYEKILERTDWSGLNRHGTTQLPVAARMVSGAASMSGAVIR